MKYSKIHNGLPESELRNFFSINIEKSWICHKIKECLTYYDKEDPFLHSMESSLNQIEFHKLEYERLNNLRSLKLLMNLKGWKEHECAELEPIIKKDSPCDPYLSFIGTDEEFEKFKKDNNLKNGR